MHKSSNFEQIILQNAKNKDPWEARIKKEAKKPSKITQKDKQEIDNFLANTLLKMNLKNPA